MKKIIKMGIGIVIVVVLAFFYAHIDKNTYLYDRYADTDSFINTGILKNQKIEQTFICEEDTIDGMNIKCSINGDVSKVTLKYSIKNVKSDKIEAEGSIKASELKNNKFHVLQTERVEGTNGEEYTFAIEEVGSDELNGVSFYILPTQTSGELIVAENATQGCVIARTVSHRFDMETFLVLLGFVTYIICFFRFLYNLFK